jgi:hypothetical protein
MPWLHIPDRANASLPDGSPTHQPSDSPYPTSPVPPSKVLQCPTDNGKVQCLAWLQSSLEPFYPKLLPIKNPEESINLIVKKDEIPFVLDALASQDQKFNEIEFTKGISLFG